MAADFRGSDDMISHRVRYVPRTPSFGIGNRGGGQILSCGLVNNGIMALPNPLIVFCLTDNHENLQAKI